jgi:hypothetical protein
MVTPGFFELYPKMQPALPAGAYLLAADQNLTATPPHGADGALSVDGSDFTFKIISPRYTMPPDQILSTFPPASAVGDWRERLPQIVFKRRTMPWERNPDAAKPFDMSTPPWLALVVLAEGEGTLSSEIDVSACVTPPLRLDGNADTGRGKYLDVTETIVTRIFPTIEDVELLCHVRKVDLSDTELALNDDDGYLAVVISNRLPQPGPPTQPGGDATSVKYTAFLLNLEGQLPILPKIEQTEDEFDFALHMPELQYADYTLTPHNLANANVPLDSLVMKPAQFASLVDAPGVVAHPAGAVVPIRDTSGSVSLSGRSGGVEHAAAAYATGPAKAAFTNTDDGREAKQWAMGESLVSLGGLSGHLGLVPLEQHFRFPVLVSWDFVCTGDGGFERLMNKLDSGMLGTINPGEDLALQPEIAPTGHVSLEHRTRRGEATQSWYRGPFTPQPTVRTEADPITGKLPIAHTGDQLRRVVPDGHEEIGNAAAFEIGRLMALSKPGIVSALMAWRRELFGAARAAALATELAGSAVPGLGDAVGRGKRRLDDVLAQQVVLPYAKSPDLIGPRATQFAVSRVPDIVDRAKPAAVLSGLGIDADAMGAATKQYGLAGLATVPVATGDATTKPLSSLPNELAALRAISDAHLDLLAGETLKQRPGQPHGIAAREPGMPDEPDGLDMLIADANARLESGDGHG